MGRLMTMERRGCILSHVPVFFQALTLLAIAGITLIPAIGKATTRPLLYDGALLSPSGAKLTGLWDFSVRFFDAASSGNELYSEVFGATSIVDGNVSLVLGAAAPEVLAAAFDHDAVWLEFEINGEKLLPRQRVVSVPYANIAGDSDKLGGSDAADYLVVGNVGPMAASNQYIDLDGLPTFVDLLLEADADATYVSTSGGTVSGEIDVFDTVTAGTAGGQGSSLDDALVVAVTTSGTPQMQTVGFTHDPTGTLASGLVNYWPMDASGGSVAPSVGSGTFTSSSTSTVAGKLAGGRQLTGGVGSYLILNPWNSAPSSAVTISLWMKSSDTANAGSLFSYAKVGDNDLLLYNTQDLALYVTGAATASGVSLSDGLWHHVVATWRSSDGEGRFYIDGQLTLTTTLAIGASLGNGGSLVLGQDQDSLGGGFTSAQSYIGVLDELAVWSRVLSDAEIDALWDGGQGSFYRLTDSFGAAVSLMLTDPDGASVDGGRIVAQLAENTGETFLGMETRTGGGPLKRTLRFSANGGLILKGNITLSGAPDFAENVTVADSDIGPGHVVALSPGGVTLPDRDGYDGFLVQKAYLADPRTTTSWAGVIGTDPGVILHAPKSASQDGVASKSNQRPLVLVGRVHVRVDPEGPPIHAADPLGLSSTPGLARRYGGIGPIVARALEPWDCRTDTETCPESVLALIFPGPVQPDCDSAASKVELKARVRNVSERLTQLERDLARLEHIKK